MGAPEPLSSVKEVVLNFVCMGSAPDKSPRLISSSEQGFLVHRPHWHLNICMSHCCKPEGDAMTVRQCLVQVGSLLSCDPMIGAGGKM